MAKGDAKLTMTGPGKGLTPMMEQYNELKTRHPDALLMVRLGDFYELFNEDAMTASKELGLYLTGREIGSGNRMPMCGVPHHAIDEYLPQLVKKGYKVAIAEQLEDPKLVKGLVKRDIIRVVSPGVLEGEDGGNNFMAAVHIHDGAIGIAYCDASTGEFRATQLDGKDATIRAIQELERLSPSEVIRAAGSPLPNGLEELLASGPRIASVTERPAHEFD
ncbi:MAG TPA: DNA mismatch repair protein MutS, partial [Bacillota bacterium]|nr:DNA mismatch repair protein MutS [Bacillota bacterium]